MHNKNILDKLLNFQNLSVKETEFLMSEILNGQISDIKLSSFLTALRMKGETSNEIFAFASTMIEHAEKISVHDDNAIDIVGTGGDCKNTINISTASAIVAASTGLTVAKHGNKSVSSKSGSADVLTSLGIKINISPSKMESCLNSVGLAFLFAPLLHPAMKYAVPVRKELGVRTIFNILGPICNPAKVKQAVIGVYEPRLCRLIAEAAQKLGYKHVIVAHGNDGLDEISTTATTKICELIDNHINEYEFNPVKYGISKVSISDLEGKDPVYNAGIIRDIFDNKLNGPMKDIIILNSAAALIVGNKAGSWETALTMAEKTINTGKALNKLNELVVFTNSI